LFLFVVSHPVEWKDDESPFYKFISLAPEFPVSMAIKKKKFLVYLVSPHQQRIVYINSQDVFEILFYDFFFIHPIAKETEMKLDTHSFDDDEV
jgi:hypothetical protein